MLRDLRLPVRDGGNGEGPIREISLRVVDGDAHLTLYRRDTPDDAEIVECSFRLPARSLLLAVRAAWDADRASGAWCDRRPSEQHRTAPPPAARTEAWRSSHPIA